MSEQVKNKTATQRIEDLEKDIQNHASGLVNLYNTINNMAGDVLNLKEAVKILNFKIDAVIQSTRAKEDLTNESLTKHMRLSKAEELKSTVTDWVSKGLLVAQETVDAASFVVFQQLNEQDEIVDPRTQGNVSQLNAILKEAMIGKKVGESFKAADAVTNANFNIRIIENYALVQPEAAPVSTETEVPSTESVAE